MITRRYVTLTLAIILICGATARAQAPQFTQIIARHGAKLSTIITWQQAQAAYVCIYGRVLLTCGDMPAGNVRIIVGATAPVAAIAVLHIGDTIRLVDVATGEKGQAIIAPIRIYMPITRR